MDQKEKMKLDILAEIDGYYMNLVYLEDLIKVDKHMETSQSINELAPNFSLIVQCALVDSYMLSLMKLYDKSEKAKTIPNLIQKCKKNIQLFCSPSEVSKMLEVFEKKLSNDKYISCAIEIIRLRRDRYHAHNDKKYFGEKIKEDESHLSKYHVWFLVDFTAEVVSYLWKQSSSEGVVDCCRVVRSLVLD